MHVAVFVHRYPPAVGGAERYAESLAGHHAAAGDSVTVWTSTAVELAEMWGRSHPRPLGERAAEGRVRGTQPGSNRSHTRRDVLPGGESVPLTPTPLPQGEREKIIVRRFRPLTFPGRRYVLKALSLVPVPAWQALTLPCNPVCPDMWRDAGRFTGPIDAVHAIAFPYSFPAACGLRLARRRRVPFLVTPFLHLGDPTDPRDRTRRQYTSRPLRWLLRQADRVFVQTPSEFRAVVDLGVPEPRVVLQGLGVDPGECTGGDRTAARGSWGVGGGCVIGHLANASEEKGTCDLLRAAAVLWAAAENFSVVLGGPEMPNFRRFWATFPHRDRVVRLGVLSDAAKRDFFAGIDVFALPSRSDSFGLVLLEAWANGVPNVAYRAGGPADLIRDGTDGRLARCGDVPGLADVLRELVRDPAKRAAFGAAGRARIGPEFTWADKLEVVRKQTPRVPM